MTTKKTTSVTAPKKLPATKPVVKKSPASDKPNTDSKNKPADTLGTARHARKSKKELKVKVVRDSFTMPRVEYQKIADIKAICLKVKMHVKKSEVLRAGLIVLSELDDTQLIKVLNDLEKIKTGRPRKH